MKLRVCCGLTSLVFLGACSASILKNDGGKNEGKDELDSLLSITHKSPELSVSLDAESRIVSVSGLSAGRIYSFAVNENNEAAQNLSCENLPSNSRIFENRIHVDLGPRLNAGTLSLSCESSGGALTVDLNYSASAIAVVSSSFVESMAGVASAGDFFLSGNGAWAVWESNHLLSNPHTQIVLRELSSNTLKIASLNPDNELADDSCAVARVTPNGRYVVMRCQATNLVNGSSGSQLYRKDLQTGAVLLVSSVDGSASTQANNWLSGGLISDDGRYVVFDSGATTLTAANNNATQVFRKDLQTGDIVVVSSTDGTPTHSADAAASGSDMSGDGRYVVFLSAATNLVSGGVTGTQVYRKDLVSGTIKLVSSTDGSVANRGTANSATPRISGNGRYVVFTGTSANLAAGTLSTAQVFLKDLDTESLVLVSSLDGGATQAGNQSSSSPRVTSNGRYVIFHSASSNLVSGTSNQQVFLKDMQAGVIELISSTDGTAGNQSTSINTNARISEDARYVAFMASGDTGLFSDPAFEFQVYLKDRQTGLVSMLSASPDKGVSIYANQNGARAPEFSGDGRYVVFAAHSSSLVPGMSAYQMVRKDLATGELALVSSTNGAVSGQANNGVSWMPAAAVSEDGRYVAFLSESTNLVAGATGWQVYLKDMQSGNIELISSVNGLPATQADGWVENMSLSDDAQKVVFVAEATNLVSGTGTGLQVYMKDRQNGAITLLSSTDGSSANKGNGDSSQAFISGDGAYVVFSSSASNLFSGASGYQIYRKHLQTGTIELVSSSNGLAVNQADDSCFDIHGSSDGRFVTFSSNAENLSSGASGLQVYRRDMVNDTIVLVSSVDGTASTQTDGSEAKSASISADGRYVAFLTDSFTAFGSQTLFDASVFVKDLQTGDITYVSSKNGLTSSQSTQPRISRDGQNVVFHSHEPQLVPGIQSGQIFIRPLR